MTKFAFDHVVHAVRDPQAAVDKLREEGFKAVLGGRHEQLGTANSLSYFDLSYIEFLGIENKAVTETVRNNPVIELLLRESEQSEGPVTVLLRTSNADHLAEKLREQGLNVYGPIHASRTRLDGSVIKWKMVLLDIVADELPPPAFIEWESSDEVRRQELVEAGLIAQNESDNVRLAHVAFAVKDADKTAAEWSKRYGLHAEEAYIDEELQARVRKVELEGGNLHFASPIGSGQVQDVLSKRGERPFLLALEQTGSAPQVKEILGSSWKLLN